MSVYQDVLNQYNEARKMVVGGTIYKDVLAPLIGDAQNKAKRDGVDVLTDPEMIALIKSFIKNIDITIGDLVNEPDVGKRIMLDDMFKRQKFILNQFLPSQMTLTQIQFEIANEFDGREGVKLSDIMTYMKANFAGQYDGKEASMAAKAYVGA